jgi:hypothetical protein
MKLAKWWFVISAAVLCLIAWTAYAADKAEALQQASEKLEAVANESQLREMGDKVALFKEAGLSYQPSLVVPVEGLLDCKNDEQLRIFVGMYTFDANYALLFGKKQEFAAAYRQINDIPDRLKLMGRLKLRTFTPDELKQVVDNPDDPASHILYAKYTASNFHDMVEASKSDQEILALLLDAGYGAAVEGLYVSSKLALAAGTGPNLVTLFNEQAARLDRVYQAMEAYAGDRELDALTKRSRHERLLKSALKILKTKKGNLAEADVEKILSFIEPVRSEVVSKCE